MDKINRETKMHNIEYNFINNDLNESSSSLEVSFTALKRKNREDDINVYNTEG